MAKRFLGWGESPVDLKPKSGGELASLVDDFFDQQIEKEVHDFLVDRYLADEVDVLGTGWTSWRKGSGIHWQKDPVSGFEWDVSKPSGAQLNLGLEVKNADVKRPWEVARFQHFTRWLAITQPKEYQANAQIAQKFHNWVTDFTQKNPIGYGVHWMNAMEVAIRAINWMLITDALRKRDFAVSGEVDVNIRKHIEYIFNHLEHKEGLANNHYLANLLGLLFGLVYFPEWEKLQEKADWILEEFESEVEKQFKTDGGNFEGSMYYHKLSTEILILGTACATYYYDSVRIGKLSEYTARALAFIEEVIKPNGQMPNFGDNDSGSILSFSPQGSWLERADALNRYHHYAVPNGVEKVFVEDYRSTVSILEMYKGLLGQEQSTEAQVLKALSNNSIEKLKTNRFDVSFKKPLPKLGPHKSEWVIPLLDMPQNVRWSYLPETGMAICRCNAAYLAISLLNREGAHRYRGHFHNDQLSVELWSGGQDLISDPGTYTYTGDMELRNEMRSAKAHNAPYFPEEPNPFIPGLIGLFHQKVEAKCELLEIGEGKITALLSHGKKKVLREVFVEVAQIRIVDSSNRRFEVNRGQFKYQTEGYGRLLRT